MRHFCLICDILVLIMLGVVCFCGVCGGSGSGCGEGNLLFDGDGGGYG